MEYVKDIRLGKLCTIYSNCSMKVIRNCKIVKENSIYIYWEEKYDSWVHAPSQRNPEEDKFKKTEISTIVYHE